MWQPLVGNDDLGVCFQARLDATTFPVPKDHVSLAVSATDPLSIRGKSHLAGISCDGMSREPFLSILTEIVGAVHENLVVQ